MSRRPLRAATVGEALLEMLRERGVEHLLGNAFTSIIDGLARFEAEGAPVMTPVMTPHEQVALSMGHGAYALSGRPQVAIVYSTPGTANAAGAVLNAARAQVPLVVLAARSALTEAATVPGARDIHVQWAQESFDQAGMLREYLKWDYELRHASQLESVVDRALEVAMDPPRGPVYIALPRDVIAQTVTGMSVAATGRRAVCQRRHPDPARIDEAAEVLASAGSPVIVTSQLGHDPEAVQGLVAVAEAAAIEVVEASPVYANFPAGHPCHAGYVFGSATHPAVASADALLVVECGVPWFPARGAPAEAAAVIQLAADPFYTSQPLRGFRCDVPLAADPAVSLPLLATALRRRMDPARVSTRLQRLGERHAATRERRRAVAVAEGMRDEIGFRWASHCIGELLDESTIVVNEYPLDLHHAPPTAPGRYFGPSHAAALGWGFGAALGAKLAAPEKTVIATLGDGAYHFAVPMACHQVSRAHGLPLLTVVFDNGGWEEVANSTRGVHPEGWAVRTSNFPMASMGPPPRYDEVVRAFDGHGERVEEPGALPAALRRGLRVVREEGRQALVSLRCRRFPG